MFGCSFETNDGHREGVVGEQREIKGERGTVVHGSYEYTHNGVHYVITYTADENGFLPIGHHLPRPVQPLPVPVVSTVPEVPDIVEVAESDVRVDIPAVVPAQVPLVHEE